MSTLVVTAICAGSLLILLATILYIVAGFRESIVWGLVNFFVPFGVLIFTMVRWRAARIAFFVYVVGLLALGGGVAFAVLNNPELAAKLKEGSGAELVEKLAGPSRDNLTGQIDKARDEILRQRELVEDLTKSLTAEYAALSEKRKALPANDAAAVAEFNRAAEGYKSRTGRLQAEKDALAAVEKRLSELLARRSESSPAPDSARPSPR